ncbi:MAG: lipid-binding SYLF domain-containing protein [Candidatus Omnitrophica bacterium]|nr:lipid-binding SYLF domain-containing protein [Candidatus Omnitrophota bacterium]MCM8794104.1 lipid-binding SYLF domain-containing protein [Candidatus Omnitrophota bacterium]
MKKILGLVWLVLFFMSIVTLAETGKEKTEKELLDEKILTALDILEEMMGMPDNAIPTDLLAKASGIAIFPGVLSGGLMIGGRYGKGIILSRDPKTGRWSPPAFYTLKGLSYGLQVGGQAIDLIMVITTERGMKAFLENKITLGGDLAAAAGPMGRDASADTDWKLKANIFSYSRSKGLFLGISLKGVAMSPDNEANKKYYGKELTAEEILFGQKVKATPSAQRLIEALGTYAK